jgi:hypothetical protein
MVPRGRVADLDAAQVRDDPRPLIRINEGVRASSYECDDF